MIKGSKILSCSIHAAVFGFVVGLSITTVGDHIDLVSSMVMGCTYAVLFFLFSAAFHTLKWILFKTPSASCVRLIDFPSTQREATDSFLLSIKVLFLLAALAIFAWQSNPLMLIDPVLVLACLYLIYKLNAAGFYAIAAVAIINILAIIYVVLSFYARFYDVSVGNRNLFLAFVFLAFSVRVATVVWFVWKNPSQPVSAKTDTAG